MGESHAEVTLERLTERYSVHVDEVPFVVSLRETFAGPAKALGRHVKQSGGHGQYAVCHIEVEPLPEGSGFEFVDKVVGGAVPRQFIPSVEKGVRAQMERGVRLGHPIVDLRVTLTDGKAHSVDSSDMAFQTAGALALREAAAATTITMLEPYDTVVGDRPRRAGRHRDERPLRRAGPGCSAPTRSATTAPRCWPRCRRPSWSGTPSTCARPPTAPASSPGPSPTTSRCPRTSPRNVVPRA